MGFTLPQFGIFAQGTHAHHFLEFDLRDGVSATEAVPSFRRLRTPDVSAGGVNLVVAFGADAWREVAPSMAPSSLGPFSEVIGSDGHRAAATQHDAWLWISGSAPDVTFDHARAAAAAISDVAVLAAEQPAFTYQEGRDETGFVDGTANHRSAWQPTQLSFRPARPVRQGAMSWRCDGSTTSTPSVSSPSTSRSA